MMGALLLMAIPLTGVWSGDRTVLTLTPNGGRIEQDCASGGFAGAVTPGKDGRFATRGVFAAASTGSGPQREVEPAPPPARFDGLWKDGLIELTITPAAGPPAQVTLRPGRGVKLIRCL